MLLTCQVNEVFKWGHSKSGSNMSDENNLDDQFNIFLKKD